MIDSKIDELNSKEKGRVDEIVDENDDILNLSQDGSPSRHKKSKIDPSSSPPTTCPQSLISIGVCREQERQNPYSFQAEELRRRYLDPRFLAELDRLVDDVERAFEHDIAIRKK